MQVPQGLYWSAAAMTRDSAARAALTLHCTVLHCTARALLLLAPSAGNWAAVVVVAVSAVAVAPYAHLVAVRQRLLLHHRLESGGCFGRDSLARAFLVYSSEAESDQIACDEVPDAGGIAVVDQGGGRTGLVPAQPELSFSRRARGEG